MRQLGGTCAAGEGIRLALRTTLLEAVQGRPGLPSSKRSCQKIGFSEVDRDWHRSINCWGEWSGVIASIESLNLDEWVKPQEISLLPSAALKLQIGQLRCCGYVIAKYHKAHVRGRICGSLARWDFTQWSTEIRKDPSNNPGLHFCTAVTLSHHKLHHSALSYCLNFSSLQSPQSAAGMIRIWRSFFALS